MANSYKEFDMNAYFDESNDVLKNMDIFDQFFLDSEKESDSELVKMREIA